MRIVFVRHGEPDYEHDCLTPLGRLQARAAAERLREEVSGLAFLPTAEQIVLTEPVEDAVEAVTEEEGFRPAAGIYRTPDPAPDVDALSAYLAAHPSNTTLLDLRAALAMGRAVRIPVIRSADGGYRVDE